MKYLISFNESNKEDVILDLRDICLEIEDSGFSFKLSDIEEEHKIEFILFRKR